MKFIKPLTAVVDQWYNANKSPMDNKQVYIVFKFLRTLELFIVMYLHVYIYI